jgi:probable H4MPT-linked C1 transfer pathway protein
MNKKNLYIGWDIGGAHTKYTISSHRKNTVECRIVLCELWKSLSQLENIIKSINVKYKEKFRIINLISMSAEMCDTFSSRKKGVKVILSLFNKRGFINHIYSDNNGISNFKSFKNYSSLASTNWMAIPDYLKNMDKNILAIDIGSTTTDLVLIKNHICINKRHDDYSGLNTKELLYTGALRTPIYSVINSLNLKNKVYNVIPENFSTMSDIYRLLSIIKKKSDYTDTADGRSKSTKDTLRRISRVFGFDYSEDKNNTINMLSRKIMSAHLDQISYTIKNHIKDNFSATKDLKIIGMGVGRILIKMISKKNNWKYMSLDQYINVEYNKRLYEPSDLAPSFLLSLLLKKYYD